MKNALRVSMTALCIVWATMAQVDADPYLGSDIILPGTGFSAISAIDVWPKDVSGGYGWWSDGIAIYTNWQDEWVEYTVYMEGGKWRIGLNVINSSVVGLPEDPNWYPGFQIQLDIPGRSAVTFNAPASDEKEMNGYATMDLPSGVHTIRFTWLNDQEDHTWGYDVNLRINTFFADRIGDAAPTPDEDDDDGGGGGGCFIKVMNPTKQHPF